MIKIHAFPYFQKLLEYHNQVILGLEIEEKKRFYFQGGSSRHHGSMKKFEDWLFTQGIIIVRENKKEYFVFFNEEDASMFLLKWGSH